MKDFGINIQTKSRISIICQSKDIIKKLKNYFMHHNYEVSTLVREFKKTINYIEQTKPDIILLSSNLYRKEKNTFLSTLSKKKDIPIVLFDENHLDLKQLQLSHCMTYPKDKDSLISVVSKRYQDKIKQDLMWLSAALVNIGDGAIVVNSKGIIIFTNKVAEKLTGVSAVKSIGRKIDEVFKIIKDKKSKPLKNPVFEAIKTSKTVRSPLDISLVASGRKISIGARATPIIDSEKNVKGSVLIFWDVTKNLEAKRALEISEENYRTLVESANSIILRTGFKGNITFANKFAQRFLGYNKKEFLSKTIADIFNSKTKISAHQKKGFTKMICSPSKYSTFEFQGKKKSGENVWISWTCKAISNQQRKKEMLWVGNDITDLKKTQNELEKAHSHLENRVKERTCQLAKANEILKKEIIFRKKTQNELSKAYQKIKTAHNQLIQSEKMAALGRFSSGIAHEIKNPLGIIMSGAEFLMLKLPLCVDFKTSQFKGKSAKKFLDAIGEKKYFNIDKNKSALENLNSILATVDFYEKWSRKHSPKNVPADIKNLVEKTQNIRKLGLKNIFPSDKIILKFLNRRLLQLSYPKLCPAFDCYDTISALNNIKTASARANEIVKNLLKFARPSDLKPGIIKPTEVIEETLNQIPLREKVNIVFKTFFGRNLYTKADKNQIMQVLINIIMNAIQSIPNKAKGIIKIKTYKHHIKKLHFGAPLCVIEIKDNGKGIDKKDMEHLFEPFFTTKMYPRKTTKSSRSTPVAGTGLGLSVSKSIIENHNGELFITSAKGKGTTVKIALPLQKKPQK